MMRTIAILPVKSLGAAKQRLGGLLGAGSRRALAQAMFLDVMASLRQVPELDAIAVVTADSVAQDAARHERVVVLEDGSEDGQSAAAGIGIRHALAFDFDRALMVAGDTPLLDPRQVSEMLRRAERERLGVVVVPDRHGTGTNALLLSPPNAIDPGFGPGSRERHELRARTLGVPHVVDAVPSLVLDVDTPEDLEALTTELERRRGLAPLTRGTLRQLDRTHARRTHPARAAEAPAAALQL
jgi:2-phospho-L-lactate guanylyltransferase